jgi:hypothetical protein
MKTPLPATGFSAGRSLKTLTKSDFRTLGLATLGGALEFYDFIIFVFFANQIGQLFFPAEIPDWLRQFQTFGLFAVGYFVRPLSGIILVKSFPPAIRFSGISLSYNISAIFGGLTPLIVAIFPANDLFGAAHYVAALCLVGFAIGLFLWKNRIQGLPAAAHCPLK